MNLSILLHFIPFFFLGSIQYSSSTFLLLVPFVKLISKLRPITSAPLISNTVEKVSLTPQEQYDLSWYVVSETREVDEHPKKVTVWGKDYVLWKTSDNKYNALQDVCSHRGVELSRGCIVNDEIQCPYHGYHFSGTGNLTKVPGLNFEPSPVYNVPRFSLVEKHGWLYLNTNPIPWNVTDYQK